jgi:hypothetical protein
MLKQLVSFCSWHLSRTKGSDLQKGTVGSVIFVERCAQRGTAAACLLCRGQGGAQVSIVGRREEHKPVLQQRAPLGHALRRDGDADLVHEQQQDSFRLGCRVHLRRQLRHGQPQRQNAQPPLQHKPAQPGWIHCESRATAMSLADDTLIGAPEAVCLLQAWIAVMYIQCRAGKCRAPILAHDNFCLK